MCGQQSVLICRCFHPLRYDLLERGFTLRDLLEAAEGDAGPIWSDPLQQAGAVVENEVGAVLHFGPAMENELEAILGLKPQRYPIVTLETETRRFPLNLLGDSLVGIEDDSPHSLDLLFPRMVEGLHETVNFC